MRFIRSFLAAMSILVPLASADSPDPDHPSAPQRLDFAAPGSLAKWVINGDVAVDPAKGDSSRPAPLRIAPGATATLQLSQSDVSGAFEVDVFDDGSSPADPKSPHVGPRWGLMRADGRILAVGSLYNSYLGGAEGFTATACDGRTWFDTLFWLGGDRGKPAWHKWKIDVRPEGSIQILCDGKLVGAEIDAAKAAFAGFSKIAIWGDSDINKAAQTIWIANASVTLGGPVTILPHSESDPYDLRLAANRVSSGPPALYTKSNPPSTPAIENLDLKSSITQYGITWTFEKPARVGQFINGDWYVIGPATITKIDPAPTYGADIPRTQLDHMDIERPQPQRVRNGFMLNPPAAMKVAYDSGVRNWFDPSLIQMLPVSMKPGDSLVSTISMPKNLVLHAQLRNKIERGEDDSSPIRTAAVLTCMPAPQPPDAFRPSFCDRQQHLYFARDLHRDLLPSAARTPGIPDIQQFIRFTQRPWVGTCFFGFEEPVENMPQYGLEYGRVTGISALLLCTDLKPEEKEPLLINLVQVGIDLGGMIRAGHPGWSGWGGHGSGRKLPIVFAGLLLGDPQLAQINRSFPRASFGEDEQTAYGPGWTGATVVFAGHSGIDAATGIGRNHARGNAWGPYEHTPPTAWKNDQITSESYRRCCTSVGWVAQALALRLMHAEPAWSHDAFFDYVDRWMYEDDSEAIAKIKAATGKDFSPDYARQRQAWDSFVNEMWANHRKSLPAPINGWQQPHDDTYYQNSIKRD